MRTSETTTYHEHGPSTPAPAAHPSEEICGLDQPQVHQFNIRAQNRPWNSGVEILLLDADRKYVITSVNARPITKLDEGAQFSPFVLMRQDAAQVLMDDLWNCGIRPTEGSGSAGCLAATQRHLEDMRTLAFAYQPHGSGQVPTQASKRGSWVQPAK